MPKYQKILEMSDDEFNYYLSKNSKSVKKIIFTAALITIITTAITIFIDLSDIIIYILPLIVFLGYFIYEIKKDDRVSMYIYIRQNQKTIIENYKKQIEEYENIINNLMNTK